MTNENAEQRIAQLEEENRLLRLTIAGHQRQMKHMSGGDEVRRLRAKIAEWEGNTRLVNGGYYHGSRFIRPYIDREDA